MVRASYGIIASPVLGKNSWCSFGSYKETLQSTIGNTSLGIGFRSHLSRHWIAGIYGYCDYYRNMRVAVIVNHPDRCQDYKIWNIGIEQIITNYRLTINGYWAQNTGKFSAASFNATKARYRCKINL